MKPNRKNKAAGIFLLLFCAMKILHSLPAIESLLNRVLSSNSEYLMATAVFVGISIFMAIMLLKGKRGRVTAIGPMILTCMLICRFLLHGSFYNLHAASFPMGDICGVFFRTVLPIAYIISLGLLSFFLWTSDGEENAIAKKLRNIPAFIQIFVFVLLLAVSFSHVSGYSYWSNSTFVERYTLETFCLWAAQLCFIFMSFALANWVFFPYEKEKPVQDSAAVQMQSEINAEGYVSMVKHVLLLLFTFGIWQYIWIYRTTRYLNCVKGSSYRNPTKKLLLCIFVPFYSIYWTYKSAQRIDLLAKQRRTSSDLATLCLILAILMGIIPPILMQSKINQLCEEPMIAQTDAAHVSEELKKYKELLDQGIITAEEFESKKKQLLHI